MTHLPDPEQFVGLTGAAVPRDDDAFLHEFYGQCIGVRNGFLQVRDADGDVFEIEISQFTPDDLPNICPHCGRDNTGYPGDCTSDDCPGNKGRT